MSYYGDIAEDASFQFVFTSRQFSTGTPFTLAGAPVLSCYETDSLVQTTTGITLTVDYDGVTGFNKVAVDTTDAFYEAGKDYMIVITTGTVDSVSVVGEVVGEFSIENRYMRGTNAAYTGTPPTAGAIADQVWDEVQSAHTTGGTFGEIATEIANILTDTGTTIPNTLSSITTNIDGVQGATVTKNAAYSNFVFPMRLSSDHYSAATAKTVTGERSIDGAAFASVTGTITEISDGFYQFDAVAADTNGDTVTWKFSATDCDDTSVTFKTST